MHIETQLLPLQHLEFAPKLLARHNEWLVLEFYNAPEAKRTNTKEFWWKLGKAIATLETVKAAVADTRFTCESNPVSNLREFAQEANEYLLERQFISKKTSIIITESLCVVPDTYCYGYLDLLAGNIIYSGGTLHLADEEGIARTIPGLSLIRPFDIWHQYKPGKGITNSERNWLLDSYNANGGDSKQLITNEKKLRTIYYLLKTYDSIISTGSSTESLKRLET